MLRYFEKILNRPVMFEKTCNLAEIKQFFKEERAIMTPQRCERLIVFHIAVLVTRVSATTY